MLGSGGKSTYEITKEVIASTYTLSNSDHQKTIVLDDSTQVSLFINTGLRDDFSCNVIQKNTGYITVLGTATINSVLNATVSINQWSKFSIKNIGSDTFVISGDLSTLWTPAEAALVAWWDPTDTSTISESAGLVSQVDDKSGNGFNLAQGTGSNQPITGTRTINGQNVLDFDGADKMSASSITLPSSGDMIFMGIMEIDAIDKNSDCIFATNPAPRFQFFANSLTQFDGKIEASGSNGLGEDKDLTGGPFMGPSIYCIELDYTGANVYNALIDGIKRTTDTTYSTKQKDTGVNFRLFSKDFGTNPPDGAVGEFLILDGYDVDDRQKAEGYLAHKYGTTANLDVSHPYKNAPPLL